MSENDFLGHTIEHIYSWKRQSGFLSAIVIGVGFCNILGLLQKILTNNQWILTDSYYMDESLQWRTWSVDPTRKN